MNDDFNLEKNERDFLDNSIKRIIKKKNNKRNFYIFLILVFIGVFGYFGYVTFFENPEVETILGNINDPEQTSNIEEQYDDDEVVLNSDRDLLKDNLANPRLSIRNATGDEVIGLDHEGTIEAKNINVTENLNVTGSGFFSWLGSVAKTVTRGWFTDIDSGDMNATGNLTVEGIKLEADEANHYIYDNATCLILKGDTSTLFVC